MDAPAEILDLIPVACYRLDKYSQIDYVNRHAELLFNQTKDSLLGRDIWEVFPEAKSTYCFLAINAALVDKRTSTFDYISSVTKGWIRLTASPAEEEGAVVSFSDIRDLKQAEQQASKATELTYKSLFGFIEQGFCIIKVIFDETLRPIDYLFLETNLAFEAQTGLRDAVGRSMRSLAPEHEEHWFQVYGEVALTGVPKHFEQRADALGRWYDVYAFQIDAPEPHHVAILFNDITERKKAEKKQHFLLKLSDALRMIADPVKVQAVASQLLGEYLGANQVHYGETIGDVVEVKQGWGNGLPPMVGTFRHQDFGKQLVEGYRAGRIQVSENITTDPNISVDEQEVIARAGFHAYLAIPLIKNGQWIATLAVHSIKPRKWTPDEIRIVEDVAERTWAAVEKARAEEALRISEERLHLMVNVPRIGILTFDYTGKLLTANDAFLTMTGYDRAEFEKQHFTWREFTPQEHVEASVRTLEQVRTTGRGDPYEKEYFCKDGTRLWMMFVPTNLGDGTLVEYAIDISDQKRAEQQLKEFNIRLELQIEERTKELSQSHLLLQGTLDSSLNMIQVFKAVRNESGQIIDFKWLLNNAASEKLYGKIHGQSLLQHNPGVIESGIFDHFVEVTQSGHPQQYEQHYVYEQFDGWFHQSVVKLNDGIATSTLDITERKKAEIELKDSRDLLQSVFNTSLIQMAVLHAVRDHNGQIEDFEIKIVNTELERETGRKDLVGKRYIQEYPGVGAAGIFNIMLRVMETGQAEGTEYFYKHEGFYKWFSCMFVKSDDGLVATNLDITQRKQAEEDRFKNYNLLQQSETLAQSGSWAYDLLTGVFTWSGGMYQLFNLEKGTKVQPEIYLQYVTEKSRIDAERLTAGLKAGTQNSEETLEILVNGAVKVIRLKSEVIKNKAGHPVQVLGIDMDITATRQAEQQLFENAAFITGIADAAPDMLYVMDLNTSHILYANHKMVEMFGLSPEELYEAGDVFGTAITDMQDLTSYLTYIEELKATASNEIKEIVLRMCDVQGQQHWIHTRCLVYKRNERGEPLQVVGLAQDVTEQIATQEKNWQLELERKTIETRQRREIFELTLSTQEEERRRMSESLHNGLGQLLYAIKISMAHLSQQQAANKPEQYIKAKAYSETLLTNAIQECRRISHELMPSVLETFGLKAAIEDICQQLSDSVKFSCSLRGLHRPLDKYLQLAIYRTIQELMTNVVRHSKATLATVEIQVNTNGITIRVQDNGKGLEKTVNSRIGIGLTSIRSKIKLLNGSVSLDSPLEGGTLAEICIPLKLFAVN